MIIRVSVPPPQGEIFTEDPLVPMASDDGRTALHWAAESRKGMITEANESMV